MSMRWAALADHRRARSPDRDQGLLIQRVGRGYRVRCATADVTAFVARGGDRRSVGCQVVEG